MRILLLGHNKWACMTLRALIDGGHTVVGVVTETDAFDRREADVYARFARFNAYESLKETAEAIGLDVHQPADINDRTFIAAIDALSPELIVCVSYHAILRPVLIDRYPDRILNAHLAPLPDYRGRAPLNWAILNGEDHTAVTVHFIDAGIDTGQILVQQRIPILESDRSIDVLLRALPEFPNAVLAAIAGIERGTIEPEPQDPHAGSYFPLRTPSDGLVLWDREKACDIHNKVRALSDPYPEAFSYVRDRRTRFVSSRLPQDPRRISPVPGIVHRHNEDGSVDVTTIDGSLSIETVRIREEVLPAAEALRLGTRFTHPPQKPTLPHET